MRLNTYSVAIRYRRPDGKLAWLLSVQDAPNKTEAKRLAIAEFESELQGTDPLAMFVNRMRS